MSSELLTNSLTKDRRWAVQGLGEAQIQRRIRAGGHKILGGTGFIRNGGRGVQKGPFADVEQCWIGGR